MALNHKKLALLVAQLGTTQGSPGSRWIALGFEARGVWWMCMKMSGCFSSPFFFFSEGTGVQREGSKGYRFSEGTRGCPVYVGFKGNSKEGPSFGGQRGHRLQHLQAARYIPTTPFLQGCKGKPKRKPPSWRGCRFWETSMAQDSLASCCLANR